MSEKPSERMDKFSGEGKNLNRNSILRVSGLLGRIFKVALEMGLISESPIKNTLLRINAEEGGHHTALPDREVAWMHFVLHRAKCRKVLRQTGLKRKRKRRKCTFVCTFS